MCYRCATMAREWTKKIWSRRRRMACAACANGLSNSAATSQYRVSLGAEPRWSRRYRRHHHLISFEQATDRVGTLRHPARRDLARPFRASAYFPMPPRGPTCRPSPSRRGAASAYLRRASASLLRRLDGKLIDYALDARGIGRDLLRAFLQIGVVHIA